MDEISPIIFLPFAEHNPYEITKRLEQLKEEMTYDGILTKDNRYHPDLQKFYALWEKYVQLRKENASMYDEVKRLFVSLYGEEMFYSYISLTKFFHQIWYLKKHKIKE